MTQTQINKLLESFYISNEDLEIRSVLHEFSNSLASIVVDEFAKNYLLNNPNLSIFLVHTDSSRLLKNIKEFISFILKAPVNEEYIQKILHVGSIHYSIKLTPQKVSYGFWAINEILYKMATVNELVKDNRVLISKIFRFVEHVMNSGFYKQKDKHYEAS